MKGVPPQMPQYHHLNHLDVYVFPKYRGVGMWALKSIVMIRLTLQQELI